MSHIHTVLVVDDDQTTLELMHFFIRSLGAQAVVATDGQTALDILSQQANDISLVLLDIAMPRMDGFAVSRAIRQDLGLRDLPIVALTARAEPEVDLAASDAGINQVVVKPFEPEQLRRVLKGYLSLS